MNKTGIEWCDMTWNPVTGCFGPTGNVCRYCYAKERVIRFQGYELNGQTTTFNPYDGLAVLDAPLEIADKFGKRRRAAFPFGFDPTFHKYRLDEPMRVKTHKDIFVGSMTDLFGKWVPYGWIREVFAACAAAPQHRYLFLTKNPERYVELAELGLLPENKNFWFGSTVTDDEMPFFFSECHNTFLSIEPILAPFIVTNRQKADWIIIGAETGNRKGW